MLGAEEQKSNKTMFKSSTYTWGSNKVKQEEEGWLEDFQDISLQSNLMAESFSSFCFFPNILQLSHPHQIYP